MNSKDGRRLSEAGSCQKVDSDLRSAVRNAFLLQHDGARQQLGKRGAFRFCEMTTMPQAMACRVVSTSETRSVAESWKGTIEMEAGDRRLAADAGSIVVNPRHEPHQLGNVGDVPARALMIFLPGGFDEVLEDLGRPAPHRRRIEIGARRFPPSGASPFSKKIRSCSSEDLQRPT